MKQKLAASKTNTVLDDIAAVIGVNATILLAAWWGGKNIVVPATRPDRSVLAQVLGVDAVQRLSAEWGGEQIFIPRLSWFEEIRKARQVHALLARGLTQKDVASVMALTVREVADMAEVGRFAAEAVAQEQTGHKTTPLYALEGPKLRGGRGGRKVAGGSHGVTQRVARAQAWLG